MSKRKAKCAQPITRPTFAAVDDLTIRDYDNETTLEERLILLIADNPAGWLTLLSDEDDAKIEQWIETGEAGLFMEVFDRFYKDTVEAIIEHFNNERDNSRQ